jgi:hypothetical protein
MSYSRVVPRDLFNEGNLLKCYGQIYLNLEKMGLEDRLRHDGEAFRIAFNEGTGGLSLANVKLIVHGEDCILERPLNSRGNYPLYLLQEDAEIEVFLEDGSFTPEMVAFLTGGAA